MVKFIHHFHYLIHKQTSMSKVDGLSEQRCVYNVTSGTERYAKDLCQ